MLHVIGDANDVADDDDTEAAAMASHRSFCLCCRFILHFENFTLKITTN